MPTKSDPLKAQPTTSEVKRHTPSGEHSPNTVTESNKLREEYVSLVSLSFLAQPVDFGAADLVSTVRRLLGSPGELKWSRGPDGLTVDLPATRPCDYAYALEVSGLKLS